MNFNNTSFPLKLKNLMIENYELYKTNQISNEESNLRIHQYVFKKFFFTSDTRGCLIYHDVGMGKTILSLSIISEILDNYIPIFISNKALHENFKNSAKKIFTKEKYDLFEEKLITISMDAYNSGTQYKSKIYDKDNIFSINNLNNKKIIIVDEAHNLFKSIINGGKNANELYNIIMSLKKNIKILFLSGTPSSKNPFELVPCFNMLSGKILFNTLYNEFTKTFIDTKTNDIKNEDIFMSRIIGYVTRAIYIENDNKDFPDKKELTIEYVAMYPDQLGEYNAVMDKEKQKKNEMIKKESSGGIMKQEQRMTLPSSESGSSYYVKSREICDSYDGKSAKAERVIEILNEKNRYPVLIYSEFVEHGIKIILNYLKKNNITYESIYGEIEYDKRNEIIKKVNSKENESGELIQVLVVSKTGAEGLDLKNFKICIMFEASWDPTRIDQFIGRIYRYKSLEYSDDDNKFIEPYLLISPNTIEEEIYKKTLEKDILNKKFRDLLKRASIECSALGWEKCFMCKSTDEELFSENYHKTINCETINTDEIEAKEIIYNNKVYYISNDNNIYIWNDKLGAYDLLNDNELKIKIIEIHKHKDYNL